MHLKSLEIQGFKSFPDKINVNFPGGITAIVGPNGSGKSNISDAIRWVLGEQSGKQLRSSKMEDVIFTGTTKRRPQGFAQVSLTIDNYDHALPVEYNEVKVTRRYYRSGESEYYINNQQVRLKDVNELFLDTGLGKDGYSIIGQGRIAEILSPKSDDRRAIIEEVAGISKYRYRKNEANRKLQATEDNLVRLYDILNELAERLPILESQSKKARQYLEYRDEKTTLDISLWMYEIERIRDSVEKLQEDRAIANGQLEDVTVELANIDKDISMLFENNQDINIRLENVRKSISEAEEQLATLQSSIAVLDNQLEYMTQDVEKAKVEMTSIDQRKEKILQDIQNSTAEKEAKTAEIARSEEKMREFYMALETISRSSEGQKQRSHEIREELERLSKQKNDLQMERISIDTQVASLNTRSAEIETAISDKQPHLESIQAEIESITAQLASCSEKLNSLTNMENGLQKLVDIKRKNLEKADENCEKANSILTGKKNRLQLLEDMEKHLEGYHGSVKAVLRESKNGRLTGIYGTVSQLIRVPDKYIIAIETALGGAIQNIVVKTEAESEATIKLLQSRNIGRVTCLPMDTLRDHRLEANKFRNCDGFVGIASDLVQTDYPKAIAFLLGNVVVVDTLHHATKLSAKFDRRYRVVTLDGQVVNVGGSLTGGSAARSAGLLSRGIELEKITAEIQTAQKNLEELQSKALKAKEDFAEADAKVEGLLAEKETVSEQMISLEHLCENKKVVLDSYEAILSNLRDEASQIAAAMTLHNAHIEQCEKQKAQLDALVETAQSSLLDVENIEGDNQQKAEQIKENITACQMEQAGIFKELEGIDNIVLQYQNQLSQINADIESRLSVIEQANDGIADACKQKEELEEMLTAGKETIAGLQKQTAELIEKRTHNETEQTSLRSLQKNKHAVRDRLVGETTRLEHKLNNITDQSETLIGKLLDEYNLTVSEAEEKRVALENIPESKKHATELRNKMRALGNVNLDSIEEYAQVKERHDFLQKQVDDLTTSKRDLEKLITELLSQMTTIFTDNFERLNQEFDVIFRELFGGGRAELILSDPSDVLNCNIDIKVAPPGKIIKSILSLSGGEQAFSAIALYFAILKIRPTPFCIMDEIEAALDDVNVSRFSAYLRRFSDKTQFITITHRRGTMEEADVLYGVTMQEKGVSKLLTINVNEMEKQLKLNAI